MIQVQGETLVQTIVQEGSTPKTLTTIVQDKPTEQIIVQEKNDEVSENRFHFSWVIGFSFMGILIGGGVGYWLSHRQKKKKYSYYLAVKHLRKKKEPKKPLPDLYPF